MVEHTIEAADVLSIDDAFFAPVDADLVDSLVARYQAARGRIEQAADFFAGGMGDVVGYFFEGNCRDGGYSRLTAERIFRLEGAIAALNSDFWAQAMKLTDVYESMPQARRDTWNQSIREQTTPEFTESTVRATLTELLLSREKFFAERVDGIFRNLSRNHVTNQPEGFCKRMIIEYCFDSWGSVCTARSGYISDLRAVIAKFMGREDAGRNSTFRVLEWARENTGNWVSVDGGALRLRAYKKGTVHAELHPEMAARLNSVLAFLYPAAIPGRFRTKPTKPSKDFPAAIGRPLPFAVLTVLEDLRWTTSGKRAEFRYDQAADKSEVMRVLAMIGGVAETGKHGGITGVAFDYPAKATVTEIICSGCVPDQRAHQFYPTPEHIAAAAVAMAEIQSADTVLEPSAGMGNIADLLPPRQTQCVEISALHCCVLEAKGHRVEKADFLAWAAATAERFSVVVANPPFSEGRWLAHLQAAAGLVKAGGRMVFVLPASAKNKALLPGWSVQWGDTYTGEFAGTGVSVVLVRADKPLEL